MQHYASIAPLAGLLLQKGDCNLLDYSLHCYVLSFLDSSFLDTYLIIYFLNALFFINIIYNIASIDISDTANHAPTLVISSVFGGTGSSGISGTISVNTHLPSKFWFAPLITLLASSHETNVHFPSANTISIFFNTSGVTVLPSSTFSCFPGNKSITSFGNCFPSVPLSKLYVTSYVAIYTHVPTKS